MNAADQAKNVLIYYFETLAKRSGLPWGNDNRTEVGTIVDLILEAVKEQS